MKSEKLKVRRKTGSSTHYKSSSGPARDNGPLFTRTPGNYANMDRDCRITNTRISHSACLAQSVRTPDKCGGCPNEVKA